MTSPHDHPDRPEVPPETAAEQTSVITEEPMGTDGPSPTENGQPGQAAEPAADGRQENGYQETVTIATAAPPPWQRIPADRGQAESGYLPPAQHESPRQGSHSAVPAPSEPPGNQDEATQYLSAHQIGPASGTVRGTGLAGMAGGGHGASHGAGAGASAARTTVTLAGANRPAAASAQPSSARRGRGPRRASLQVKRVDPWSVLKLALVLSVALFFVWLVAVGVLYGVLDGMGVWDKLNSTYNDLVQSSGGNAEPIIGAGRVFGVAAIIGAVNIVLITAMATVGAFVYNVSADLAGGIEVTLSERE